MSLAQTKSAQKLHKQAVGFRTTYIHLGPLLKSCTGLYTPPIQKAIFQKLQLSAIIELAKKGEVQT